MQGRITPIVHAVLFIVPVALTAVFAYLFIDANREYRHFRYRESQMQERVVEREKVFERKRVYFEKLAHDPEFLEAVVRERLGFAKEGEVIFRFVE